MGVQPVLEAVDVPVGGGLSGRRDTIRKVVVESSGSRLRLTDDGRRDCHDDERQRRRESQQHDRDREAAGQPDPLERPHERVEQQRDEPGNQKEEDDMTRGGQEDPREDQEQRQAHKLDPARHLNARRAAEGAHRGDATARVVPIRPPDWDWSFSTDGALALAPALNYPEQSATVPRMPPAGPHRRARATQRRHLERERRLRRLAVLFAIAVVALVTLLLSAFGGSGAPAAAPPPASASRLLPAGPPRPEIVGRIGALHLQLPVSQSRVTAIGYQGGTAGSLALDPLGSQANQGLLRRLAHSIFGGSSGGTRWYQLPGGQGPATSALQVGAAAGTDVYSPVDGTVLSIGDVVLNLSLIHI